MKLALIFAIFAQIIIFTACPATAQGNDISACWETWSRCTTWSSGLTGILWQSCAQRCQCIGWTTGSCQLRPSKCPLTSKAWGCICSKVQRPGPKPLWCGF